MIEVFEPLVEIISGETMYFTTLNPGERGTTLKMCIDSVISIYGQDIFKDELSDKKDYEDFLKKLVISRNRIFHIKRETKKPYFAGKDPLKYSFKIYLFYRIVILELIGVRNDIYKASLINCLEKWDNLIHKHS